VACRRGLIRPFRAAARRTGYAVRRVYISPPNTSVTGGAAASANDDRSEHGVHKSHRRRRRQAQPIRCLRRIRGQFHPSRARIDPCQGRQAASAVGTCIRVGSKTYRLVTSSFRPKNGFASSGIGRKRGTVGSVGKGGIGKTITEVGVQRTANLLQH
jgi:hypothetical protein